MPLKNGIEVVQEIRVIYNRARNENPGLDLQDPRFVFLTAFKTKQFVAYLKLYQVSECFEKPIEID